MALRLESYKNLGSDGDRGRAHRQVRGVQEQDSVAELTKKLDDFGKTQEDSQNEWRKTIESRIERTINGRTNE